jgi:hypothetical protein
MSDETAAANWTVDKSKFPPGPWMDEPDRVEWRHLGFPCLIVRQKWSGHLCGYVGVPPGHPHHGDSCDDVDVDVHGGLTFADRCHPGTPVCHVPRDGEPADVWWLGFDCAHSFDCSPSRSEDGYWGGTYRNIDYVTRAVERLAEQLRASVPQP